MGLADGFFSFNHELNEFYELFNEKKVKITKIFVFVAYKLCELI